MKHLMRSLLLMAMFGILAGHLNAQYYTSHAKIAMPGQQKGIYYSLPRTVIQLDLMIDKTELLEGPFSNYANMVGADDVITSDQVEYVLRDVVMSTYAEADPNATFFVSLNQKKTESLQLHLNSKGILEGVAMEAQNPPVKPAPPVKVQVSAENASFKYQFGPSGGRSEELRARAAADMINRIREEKIKLITGFQETAFTLETYRQMFADLNEMEAEYLSLFVGKRVVTPVVQTVYVTLTKDVPLQTVGSFSKETGFSTSIAEGNALTVQAISLKTTSQINGLSKSAVESISHEDKIFYRIPETANVKVCLNEEVLLERREILAQFGIFMLAPLNNTKMLLDPNTGQIVNMDME